MYVYWFTCRQAHSPILSLCHSHLHSYRNPSAELSHPHTYPMTGPETCSIRPFHKLLYKNLYEHREYTIKFVETWQVDMEWVWNLDLRTIMFSGKKKVSLTILYISLRNTLWSREVGVPRIHDIIYRRPFGDKGSAWHSYIPAKGAPT